MSTRSRPIVVSLVARVSFLLSLAFFAAFSAAVAFWMFLNQTDQASRHLDELGRQRMLSTKMVSLAQQIEASSPHARDELQQTIDQFEATLIAFSDTNSTAVPSRKVPPSVIQVGNEMAASWTEFGPQLEILIDDDADSATRQQAQVLVLQQGPQMAELADQAVQAYRRHLEELQFRTWRFMVLVASLSFLLLLVGSFLTHHHIARPLHRLERTARKFRRRPAPSTSDSNKPHELQAMEQAFDAMADEIEKLVERLERQREFAESLIQHAPAGVVVHRQGNIILTNPRFLELTSVNDRAILENRNVLDFFLPKDQEEARALITDLAPMDPQGIRKELRLAKKGETPRTVEVISVPIKHDDGPATFTVFRDLTEHKLLTARMMQMDRVIAIGTLVAGVGHEINNPLTFVLGNLDYIKAQLETLQDHLGEEGPASSDQPWRPLVEELQEAAAEAHLGGQRIRDIVTELRTLSSSDDVPLQHVDVVDALESAISMAIAEIRPRAQLIRRFEAVPQVYGNESRLAQVFLNLLINAAHAIDEGDSANNTITVRTRKKESQIVVEIADTGCGISPDVVERLFDPFFTTKSPGEGTGLGLPICQQIVEAHDGVLLFDSAVGEGTTFSVMLPIDAADQDTPATEQPTGHTTGQRRLAIIDDEPLLLDTFTRHLGDDHQLHRFEAPQDFMDELERGERFDLIFCDLMMPGLSGMEIYEVIRQQYPDLLDRMVFMSGGATTPKARDFIDTVVPILLSKPFDFDTVRELIADIEPVGGGPGSHKEKTADH